MLHVEVASCWILEYDFGVPFLLTSVCLSRPFGSSTSLSAEKDKWDEKDYEGELQKLEKEAEKRLEDKIAELMSKIETTGSK